MIRLGDFELHTVSDGTFRLDGGAMFGIVPKPAWEKVSNVDDQNRVLLSLSALLIRTGDHNVLVDTGIGTKHDARFCETYEVNHFTTVPESLNRIGVSVEEIDTVILSHLHFDHAGGATFRKNGDVVPTFPNATHVIQKGMWDEAQDPNPRTKGSYVADDFLPLKDRTRFVEGDEEIVPGIRVWKSGGHVKHHQCVEVLSGGRKAIYWADLLPTTAHVRPAWVMGYDLFPHEVAATKAGLLEQAVKEEWVNVFEHDPKTAMGIIRKDGKKYIVEELVPAARPE